jgi:hypothetical protein
MKRAMRIVVMELFRIALAMRFLLDVFLIHNCFQNCNEVHINVLKQTVNIQIWIDINCLHMYV